MTREQLIGTIGKNGRRLKMRGSDLSGFDFSGLDLTGADLRFSNLSRSNFRGAILRGADLSFSDLNGTDFTNADLYEANLSFSGMEGANLTGANVEGAKINFSGRGNYRPEPIRPEPITLTTILQQPGWGTLIGMMLGALLVYGSNAVIFFTNLIQTTEDPLMAGFYRYLTVQNATDGAVVFLLTWSLVGWLSRQFRAVWVRHLIITIVALVAFAAVNTCLFFLIGKQYTDQLMQRETFMSENNAPWYHYVLGNVLIANVFLYILQQGRQLTRKLSEQEYQLLNMEKLKTRAELDALQAKINPHFLYNSLNSIASLVHEDPDKAEEMTLLLSKLFRYSTGRDGELFSTIADELEMVRTYLQVEQVRFGNRLTFSVEVSNPALNELRLPQFLLQPIVENAIKHGVSKRADMGRIDVRIYEQSGYLHLCVHDNGPDFSETMGGGYGLRSIQDKLKLLYGDDAQVELQNRPLKQVLLSIRMSRLQTTSTNEYRPMSSAESTTR